MGRCGTVDGKAEGVQVAERVGGGRGVEEDEKDNSNNSSSVGSWVLT